MRLRCPLLALTVLTTVGCPALPDPAEGEGEGESGEGEGEGETGPGDGVLIFTGHGAAAPPGGMFGDMTHAASITRLEGLGLTVTQGSVWSTEATRLVILPAPGFNDDAARFSSSEIDDMAAVVDAGGVVVIEGENSAVLDPGCVNDVLAGLGATMVLEGSFRNGAGTDIATHPLTTGIDAIAVAASGEMVIGTDLCLIGDGSGCFVGVHERGAGYVVFIADGNILSVVGDAIAQDNALFLDNLAQLDRFPVAE